MVQILWRPKPCSPSRVRSACHRPLPWAQGFLGDWGENGVQDAYHVEAIPAVFLIGPDGRLKAQGLRGEAIAAAVANALNEP